MESVAVGLIVDSSIVIVAERRGNTVTQILEDWESVFGEVEIGISVITVLELTHGARRAKGEDRRQRRQAFLDELIRDVHVYAVTTEIARLAGRITSL